MLKRILAAVLFSAWCAIGAPGVLPSALVLAQAPPPVPALPDAERRTRYIISNQTGPFAVGFYIYGDGTDYSNWLEVWLNGVKLTPITDWTLAPSSGSFTTLARPIPSTNVTLTAARTGTLDIISARHPRRLTQFSETSAITGRSFNLAFNDAMATIRDAWDLRARTVMAPPGETLNNLPAASARAGNALAFDGSGNPVVLPLVPGNVDITTVLTRLNNLSDLTNTTLARTNLGLGTAATQNIDTINTLTRVTGTGAPSSGAGLELAYTSGTGIVQAFSRPSTFQPLNLFGSTVLMGPGSGNGVLLDTTKFAPVTDSAFDLGGASNYWNKIYGREGVFAKAGISGLRVDGNSQYVTGAGLELLYSGGAGFVQAFSTATGYTPLRLIGNNVLLGAGSGTVGVLLDATKLAPTSDSGFALGDLTHRYGYSYFNGVDSSNLTARGSGTVDHAQLFRYVPQAELTASLNVQGTPNTGQSYAGPDLQLNLSADGSFGVSKSMDRIKTSWNWSATVPEGWVSNGTVPLGDDTGREIRASVLSIYTTLQSRHLEAGGLSANGTGFANGSGNVTSATGTASGYTPGATIDVVISGSTPAGAPNNFRVTAVADGSGIVNGATVTGLPKTGYAASSQVYVLLQPPNVTNGGGLLDIGPLILLRRVPSEYGGIYPKAGSLLGGIGTEATTNNGGAVGGSQSYGYLLWTITNATQGSARSRLELRTAENAGGHSAGAIVGYRSLYGVKGSDASFLTDAGAGTINFEDYRINSVGRMTVVGSNFNISTTDTTPVRIGPNNNPTVLFGAAAMVPVTALGQELGNVTNPWSAVWVGAGKALVTTSNLSDVANVATSRTNLGLGAGNSVVFSNATLSSAGAHLLIADTGTTYAYTDIQGGGMTGLRFGQEGSSGGNSLVLGSAAGDGVVNVRDNKNLILAANNAAAVKIFASGGVTIGSPTGGDKGIGSLNLQGDIWKNNSAYNNPDYVFEHFYRSGQITKFASNEGAKSYAGLMPLPKLRDYTRANLRLPGISDEPAGMFARSDTILEKIEEAYLYILALHERLAAVERRFKR